MLYLVPVPIVILAVIVKLVADRYKVKSLSVFLVDKLITVLESIVPIFKNEELRWYLSIVIISVIIIFISIWLAASK